MVIHVALSGTGFTLLRAFGLVPAPTRRRMVLAAFGPALLAGAALVLPLLLLLLVLGISLNLLSALLVCLACTVAAEWVARSRAAGDADAPAAPVPARATWLARGAVFLVGAYFAAGAFVVARLPTVVDDARIWSPRGLTLAYYHRLQPEIFQNQAQSGGHPVYPLFQPALEALTFQAMGRPQLRFFHLELWLLFGSAIWTAAYLILRTAAKPERFVPMWIAPLVLLALTPAVLDNVAWGYADITGSVILATGALALALWLDRGQLGLLALAVVLLAAAANTKNEELVAAVLVLLIGLIAGLVRASVPRERMHRLQLVAGSALSFAVLVAPWRIWVAVHHLSESVEPPVPHALSPSYLLSRTHQLNQTVTAMLQRTSSEWRWLAAIFIATCVICIAIGAGRRVASFYLASVAAIVISLLWLYTTTREDLAFLLQTSMNRTVDLFMVPAAVATAHLLAHMQRADGSVGRAQLRGAGGAHDVENDLVESPPDAPSPRRG